MSQRMIIVQILNSASNSDNFERFRKKSVTSKNPNSARELQQIPEDMEKIFVAYRDRLLDESEIDTLKRKFHEFFRNLGSVWHGH